MTMYVWEDIIIIIIMELKGKKFRIVWTGFISLRMKP